MSVEPVVQEETPELVGRSTSDILESIKERGSKRLSVATNAAGFAIFGDDDSHEITLQPEDVAMSEIVAIRVLTQLREAGLLDNEPLLGLATTKELLTELESRGRTGLDGLGGGKSDELLAITSQSLIDALPEDVLNYSTAKKLAVAGEPTNNTSDDADKENTE